MYYPVVFTVVGSDFSVEFPHKQTLLYLHSVFALCVSNKHAECFSFPIKHLQSKFFLNLGPALVYTS